MKEKLIEEMKELYKLVQLLDNVITECRAEHKVLSEKEKRTKEEGQRMKLLEGTMNSTIYAHQGRKKDLAEKKQELIDFILGE